MATTGVTLKTTLAVWLYAIKTQKRQLDGISTRYNVNYLAGVTSGDKVNLKVTSIAPDGGTKHLDSGANQVQAILDGIAQKVKPVMRDISRYSETAEGSVASIMKDCHVCPSPDGRTILVGPTDRVVTDTFAQIQKSAKHKRNQLNKPAESLPDRVVRPGRDPPPRGAPYAKGKRSELIAEKYLWIYVSEVCRERVSKATLGLTIREEPWGEALQSTRIILAPRSGRADEAYDKLETLVTSLGGRVTHVELAMDAMARRRAQLVVKSKNFKKCIMYHDDVRMHIIAKDDVMPAVKQDTEERLGLKPSPAFRTYNGTSQNGDANRSQNNTLNTHNNASQGTSHHPEHGELQPPPGDDGGKYAPEELLIERYLWMYMNHVCVNDIKRVVSPYKINGKRVEENVRVELVGSDPEGQSDKSECMNDLAKLVAQYEEIYQHDTMTALEKQQQRSFDEIKSFGDVSLVYRDEETIHIITRRQHLHEVRRKIADKCGLPGDADADGDPQEAAASGKPGGQQQQQPQQPEMKSESYRWNDRVLIHVFEAEIAALEVDAVVSAANPALSHVSGVAKEIGAAAGGELQKECTDRVRKKGEVRVSETYVSKGYKLPCKHVIHAVGPMWKSYKDKVDCVKMMNKTFTACLNTAETLRIQTMAIPSFASGTCDVLPEKVAKQLYLALTDHLRRHVNTPLRGLSLVDTDTAYLRLLQEEFSRGADGIILARLQPAGNAKPRRGGKTAPKHDAADDTKCTICMGEIKGKKRLGCGHEFCKECIENWGKERPACPNCGFIFGEIIGDQPLDGRMTHAYAADKLPGHEDASTGTIQIIYTFPNGKQTAEHPNPGKSYKGVKKTAYLPKSEEGEEVLALLRRAFKNRLIFTIARADNPSMDGQITWNDIHHKTSMTGGPNQFGYPDPTYLARIKEELALKGIK